jgi:hypothetical protein
VARHGYAVGSAVLAAVLPTNDGPTVAAPVAMNDAGLELRDEIEAKEVIRRPAGPGSGGHSRARSGADGDAGRRVCCQCRTVLGAGAQLWRRRSVNYAGLAPGGGRVGSGSTPGERPMPEPRVGARRAIHGFLRNGGHAQLPAGHDRRSALNRGMGYAPVGSATAARLVAVCWSVRRERVTPATAAQSRTSNEA